MSDQHPEPQVPSLGPRSDGLAPPPEAAPRRRLGTSVLTAVAGLLVVGSVGIAIVTLSEGDGSATPEDAVERLFQAVDRQDALGVAESLEPTERRILVTALEDAADEAERVKVIDDGLDLRAVDGVDLTVDDLAFTAKPLDDETSAVDITSGQISSRAQLSKMPIGPVIQEVIDRNEEVGQVDKTSRDEIDLAGTRIVAVERGGEWYVSGLFSLAEQIRLDGSPVAAYPSARTAIPAIGADTPEAAVREGIAAAVDADVRRLIELTPADEARMLHTYGPILVDAAKGEETSVTIDDLDLTVADASNGRKRVSATSMTMTVESRWDRQVTTYDGTCSTITWEAKDPEAYGYGEGDDSTSTWTQCDDEATSLSPFGLFNVIYAPGSLDIIVEEHDGAWFLSPSGTLVQNTVGAVAALDADAVRRMARAWGGEWWLYQSSELWDACGVAEPSLDDSRTEAEAAYERCLESLPDDYDGPWGPRNGGGSVDSSEGVLTTPGMECYETNGGQPSMDAIEECLAGLVEAGALDPSELASFRCNRIFEDVDTRDDLSDDEFNSLMDDANDRYAACMRQAGNGEGASFGPSVTTTPPPSTPSTTQPSTTTTARVPSTTTSTTRPAATTTTSQP